jgi:hypothetical protein
MFSFKKMYEIRLMKFGIKFYLLNLASRSLSMKWRPRPLQVEALVPLLYTWRVALSSLLNKVANSKLASNCSFK